VKWQLLKIWVKRLFIFSLSIIFLFVLLTIFLNQIIPKKQLKSLLLNVGKSYLNREINFQKIYINIFKGIIISSIDVSPVQSITNSAKFKIDEIQLRHNWKSLLRLKIDINKIIVKNLQLIITKKQLKNEINFYQQKFKKKKIETLESKKIKIKIDIKAIESFNNKIVYKISNNDSIDITLENFLLKFGTEKGIKLKAKSEVLYKNIKAVIKKELISTKKKQIIEADIWLPEKNLNFNLYSFATNKQDFTINLKAKFAKKLFRIIGNFSFFKNILNLKNFKISDLSQNLIFIDSGYINFDSGLIKLNTKTKLVSFQKKDILFITDFNNQEFNFNINGNIKINIVSHIKNLKNVILNGKIDLYKSEIKTSNETINIENLNSDIIKNNLEAKTTFRLSDKIGSDIEIKKDNIFDKSIPIEITGKVNNLNLKTILTNFKFKFQPEDIKINLKYFIDEKKIKIDDLNFKINTGKFKLIGIYNLNKEIPNTFFIKVKNFPVKNIITNQLNGNISGEANISFRLSKSNKLILTQFYGNTEGNLLYKEYKFFVTVPFRMNENILNFSNGLLKIEKNIIYVSGKFNLKTEELFLDGNGKNFTLARLKRYNLSGKSKINFSFYKNFKQNEKTSFNINIGSDSIVFNNLKFNNVNGGIFIEGKNLKANLKVDKFYSGKINLDGKGPLDKIKISGTGEDIELEKMIKELTGENISGKLKFKLDGIYNLKKGKINLELKAKAEKGEMRDTKFQKNLSGFLNLLPLQDIFYKNIDILLKINEQTIYIEKVKIIGYDQIYKIDGIYNIENELFKLKIRPQFNEDFVMNVPIFLQLNLPIVKEKEGWYYIKNIHLIKEKGKKTKIEWSLK